MTGNDLLIGLLKPTVIVSRKSMRKGEPLLLFWMKSKKGPDRTQGGKRGECRSVHIHHHVFPVLMAGLPDISQS